MKAQLQNEMKENIKIFMTASGFINRLFTLIEFASKFKNRQKKKKQIKHEEKKEKKIVFKYYRQLRTTK